MLGVHAWEVVRDDGSGASSFCFGVLIPHFPLIGGSEV
jgi:hypothetical protein